MFKNFSLLPVLFLTLLPVWVFGQQAQAQNLDLNRSIAEQLPTFNSLIDMATLRKNQGEI